MSKKVDETPLFRVVYRGHTHFVPAERLNSPEIMLRYDSMLIIENATGRVVKSRWFSPVGD